MTLSLRELKKTQKKPKTANLKIGLRVLRSAKFKSGEAFDFNGPVLITF